MDFKLEVAFTEHPACRFPGSSQAGTNGAIDGDAGEHVMHRVRLLTSPFIQSHVIRIGNDVAIVIDIVDRAMSKQIDAAALRTIQCHTLGLHNKFG